MSVSPSGCYPLTQEGNGGDGDEGLSPRKLRGRQNKYKDLEVELAPAFLSLGLAYCSSKDLEESQEKEAEKRWKVSVLSVQ